MSEAANERSGVLMSIRGVTKAFGSNVVLKGINMDVKKGEVIALMDKVNLEAELRSSEAQLASSKSEYEYQLKTYNRNKALHEKKLISDSDYDQTTYNYQSAKAAYNQAQANIIKVRRNLG